MPRPAAHTISDVYARLRDFLAPDYQVAGSDDLIIERFLDSLRSGSDANSTRLLISLGIDVNNYHKLKIAPKDLEAFRQLIRRIILKIKDLDSTPKTYPKEFLTPALLFGFALREFSTGELQPAICIAKKNGYVRVSNFSSYIKYIVVKNSAINNDLPASIDTERLSRLYDDFESGRRYRNIQVTKLSSRKGWVFLACKGDVDRLIKENNLGNLLDNLGFYLQAISPADKFISFEYPRPFNQPIFQPTSLTADWGEANDTHIGFGNEFFLSYKVSDKVLDSWGRTFSVSGKWHIGVKERIHFPLDNDDKDKLTFSAAPLGELKKTVPKTDLMAILKEALHRYSNSI